MPKPKDLSVGEVAKRSGVNISSLHFYEERGLIESSRNNANHRRYHRGVLRKIAVIKAAQKVGIPLKEIQTALGTIPDGKTVTIKDWSRLSSMWKADLDLRIHQLVQLRDGLTGCIGCGCLSITDCHFINPDDLLSKHGPGAHLMDRGIRSEGVIGEGAKGAGITNVAVIDLEAIAVKAVDKKGLDKNTTDNE